MRRFPKILKRKYQIKSMKEKHHAIKRLDSLGIKHKEIAKEVGCTPENVCQVTGSELYMRELDVLRVAKDSVAVDVGKRIIEIGVKGLDLLDDVVNGKGKDGQQADISLRVRVAMDALDRRPESAKVKTIQGDLRHHLIGVDVLERIKERAALAQQQALADGAVEAEYEIKSEAS